MLLLSVSAVDAESRLITTLSFSAIRLTVAVAVVLKLELPVTMPLWLSRWCSSFDLAFCSCFFSTAGLGDLLTEVGEAGLMP